MCQIADVARTDTGTWTPARNISYILSYAAEKQAQEAYSPPAEGKISNGWTWSGMQHGVPILYSLAGPHVGLAHVLSLNAK